MKRLVFRPASAVMLIAVLALGACSQGGFNRGLGGGAGGAGGGFDAAGAGGPGGLGGGAAGGAGAGTGGPSDPTSPAYFSSVVGDRVFFAVDQSTLGTDAQQLLAAQAQWLIANPEFTALIEGHADEQGTREYNLALGARRAASVREFLVSQGVPASRLRTISFGKERPVEICSTESCYSQNRRAVTVISAGLAS